MACLALTGFEIHNPSNGTLMPDNPGDSVGSSSLSSTNPRSGATAARQVGGGFITTVPAISASLTYYLRGYMSWNAMPGSTGSVITVGGGDNIIAGRLTSGGKIQLWNMSGTPAQIGSDSAATVSTGTYYRLELSWTTDGSTNVTACELRLDGVTVASTSGLSISAVSAIPGFFGLSAVTTDLDDVMYNDSSGSVNNSWPGNGMVVLMKPTSETQRGSWTGGAGGTTNLFDAVNNTPPIGTASETDSTQIESTDSSGDNATDEIRLDCGSYSGAGIGASDTIDALAAWVNHGEDVATNTKTGSFGFQSNPAVAYTTFTFGNDVGALGTYPTNWVWKSTAIQEAPSVTKGSSLILAARKTDAGTRVASIDFIGAYVGYTPAATPLDPTQQGQPLLMTLSRR